MVADGVADGVAETTNSLAGFSTDEVNGDVGGVASKKSSASKDCPVFDFFAAGAGAIGSTVGT